MVTLDPAAVRTALDELPASSGLADLPDGGWKLEVGVSDGTVTLWVHLAHDLARAADAEAPPNEQVPGLHIVSPVLSGEGGLGVDVARHALAATADEANVRVGWCPAPDGTGPVLAAVAGLALDDLDVAELHETVRDLAETASRLQITLHAE